MNINATSPRDLDRSLQQAEAALREARAKAEAQRQADEERARIEAEEQRRRDEAIRLEREQREAVYAAEQEAAAEVARINAEIESARLASLVADAENSEAGRTLLERAYAELELYGDGRMDLRDSTDEELWHQASRVLYQITGLAVPAECWATVEPSRVASVVAMGTTWVVSFTPSEAPELFVEDRNHAWVQVRALATLATMVEEGALPGLVDVVKNLASINFDTLVLPEGDDTLVLPDAAPKRRGFRIK